MTNEEINKRIHEILGMCWHEYVLDTNAIKEAYVCKKCKISKIIAAGDCKDFATSWTGFGILWEFWQKHQLKEDFYQEVYRNWNEEWINKGHLDDLKHRHWWEVLLSPLALTQATVKFFKEEQK